MAKDDTSHLADTSELSSNGAARPTPLSTTGTLFWRIFVPVFSTVLLTGFLAAFVLIPEEELYLSFPAVWARLVIAAIWLLWIFFMYRTLWRLHRIDADGAYVYVTNYWTVARYPWNDVEKFTESRHLGRRIAHLHLRAPGRFGQKISFLPSSNFNTWMETMSYSS